MNVHHINLTRLTLPRNSQRKSKKERSRITWRRNLEANVKETEYGWREFERLAHDRNHVGCLTLTGLEADDIN